MDQVRFIVLGAVLAIITSVIAEYVRFRISDDRSKRHFRNLLKFELPEIAGVIDRLIEDASRAGGMISLIRLDELTAARAVYDRHNEWLVIFKDTGVRRDVYNLFRELSLVAANARVVEGIASQNITQSNPSITTFVANRRRELTDQFRALVGRARALENRVDELK